ncbi:pseudouridine synthase, partial [Campylobacter jejuni]|nr:pseudouridine synthase [Campylobacter jejuni]
PSPQSTIKVIAPKAKALVKIFFIIFAPSFKIKLI